METALSGCALRKPPRRNKRPPRNQKAKNTQRTAGTIAHDFLSERILPICFKEDVTPHRARVETCFFSSLANLCHTYKISLPDVRGFVFPHNIYAALQIIQTALKQVAPHLQLIVIDDEATLPAVVATVQVFDIGQTLYYLPLRPAWKFIRTNRNTKRAALLVSVLAFMHQVLRVPSCLGNSYIGYTHEMIRDMETENKSEYTEREYREAMFAINEIFSKGKRMMNRLSDNKQVAMFQKRVAAFKPVTASDEALLQLAEKALRLLTTAPMPYYENCMGGVVDPSEESRSYPDEYVSFVWYSDGWMASHVHDYVNGDLSERGIQEEPLHLVLFNRAQSPEPFPFAFENNVFELLGDTAHFLYHLP